ncbi:MAG: AEC family transporter [Paracoccaceae bacterium]
MFEIFLKTLPFFALIAMGYGAGRTKFFSEEATAYLTKFVFYFALSAMIFRFSSNLALSDLAQPRFIMAYLWGSGFVYGIGLIVAFLRGKGIEEASIEAQCTVIGNTGFLGVPMLALLLGPESVGPVMMVLSMDLIVFGSLIVILVTGGRDGRMHWSILGVVGMGLLKNPMIMSMALGLFVSAMEWHVPGPVNEFVSILGGAATPGALFAIGASLASKSAERMVIASWLSFAKLFLHPAFVAFSALVLFPLEPYPAAVMISCASLPVAGNIYILAQHYGIAPQRVSASILISTAVSVLTVPLVIAWVMTLYQ